MITVDWAKRARDTSIFHKAKIKDNHRWTIRDTAEELDRSYGSVNEDLQLADWLKSHPKIEDQFKNIRDALKFIRTKRLEYRKRGN